MKITESQLREIIREQLKRALNEEDYDTLRDKYGRIGKRSYRPSADNVYLDVDEATGRKLQMKYRGRIFKDDSTGSYYMPITKALAKIPKAVKDNMDTNLTDRDVVKRVKKMPISTK